MTVPLVSLFRVPNRMDLEELFNDVVNIPDWGESRGQLVATNNALAEYFEDKLTWPVTIERQYDLDGSPRYIFSIYGEELANSNEQRLPLESLDPVSFEPLHVVSSRVAAQTYQVVTMAMVWAAYTDLIKDDLPLEVEKNREAYALSEVLQHGGLAQALFERADLLMRTLEPSNEQMRFKFSVLHQQIRAYRDHAAKAMSIANNYHTDTDNNLDEELGEWYDEAVKNADERGGVVGFIKGGFSRLGRFAANIGTGGGMRLDAENAQMFRRGEISYSAYKKNRWMNLGRVGVTALVTALTAGRGSSVALRFLGLEAGTAAAIVTTGMVEGMAQAATQSFSSDAYAFLVAHATGDPGVSAFHEATIGGPTAWLESTAWGGIIGGGTAFLGSLAPKTPFDPSKLRRETTLERTEPVAGGEMNNGWRIISDDPQTGAVTMSVRHPTTGELFIVEGDAYTGNAVMTNTATGEVVGYYREGKFGPVSSGGELAAGGEIVPPGFSGASVEETGLISVSEDMTPAAPPEVTPPAETTPGHEGVPRGAPQPGGSAPLTLDELRQQAVPLRAERARLASRLNETENRVQTLREQIDEVAKRRAERRLPQKPAEAFEKALKESEAKAADQLWELEQTNGKLAEVEGEIQKLTPPDPSRPTWRQSEIDVGRDLGPKFKEQQSYLNHEPVPAGTEGSVRPDLVATDGSVSVEVKNYDLSENANGLMENVSSQAIYRTEHLPVGMRQKVVIDIRGQVVAAEQQNAIVQGIVRRSKGAIRPEDIRFKE